MQYGILAFAVVTFVLTYLLQPETSQPGSRGVDRMLATRGKASWVWLNPLKGLALLRSPNISLVVSIFIAFKHALIVRRLWRAHSII